MLALWAHFLFLIALIQLYRGHSEPNRLDLTCAHHTKRKQPNILIVQTRART